MKIEVSYYTIYLVMSDDNTFIKVKVQESKVGNVIIFKPIKNMVTFLIPPYLAWG